MQTGYYSPLRCSSQATYDAKTSAYFHYTFLLARSVTTPWGLYIWIHFDIGDHSGKLQTGYLNPCSTF